MGHLLVKRPSGGKRIFTPVANNGSVKTGLVVGDWTVILAALSTGNPPTTVAIVPDPILTGPMAGSWIVDIPSGFMGTHGVGDYYLRAVVGATGPKYDATLGEPILVTQNLLDDISAGGGASLSDIQDVVVPAIEYQRGHHTAETYLYVDPSGGNDGNDGLTRGAPFLTVGAAVTAITQEHTAIVVLGNASGQQVISENIVLSTPYTFLRGPGFDIQLAGNTTNVATVQVTAAGCELSGFEVTTPGVGTGHAIDVDANFVLLQRLRVVDAIQDGIDISGGSRSRIEECIVENAGRYGVHIQNTSFAFIGKDTLLTGSGTDNLRIQPGAGSADDTIIKNITSTSAGGYGIFVGAGSNRTQIFEAAFVANTSGNVQDDGTDTIYDPGNAEVIRIAIMTHIVNGNPHGFTLEETVDLIRKVAANRLELTDGQLNNLVLYDDDGSTPLIEWDQRDKLAGTIEIPLKGPARRGLPDYTGV